MSEKSSLSPVQEEAPPTLGAAAVSWLSQFIHKAADSFAIDAPLRVNQDDVAARRLRDLASALPALLEASRRDQQTAKALEATNIGGIMDIFTDPADALTQMALHIRDLETRLAGSISERETLTARCTKIEQALDRAQATWSEIEREIPRCANCHDSGWKRIPHDNTDCGQCTAEGRALRDRLRTSHLAASLAKSRQQELQLWRDRVLSEIEALPTSHPTNAIHLEALGWVAGILRRGSDVTR